MTEFIQLTKGNGVAVITINNPPVNALSPGVPEGISEALDQIAQDVAFLLSVLFLGGVRLLLLEFVLELLFTARKIRAGNDGVVDSGNNLLYHRVGTQGRQNRKAGEQANQTQSLHGGHRGVRGCGRLRQILGNTRFQKIVPPEDAMSLAPEGQEKPPPPASAPRPRP